MGGAVTDSEKLRALREALNTASWDVSPAEYGALEWSFNLACACVAVKEFPADIAIEVIKVYFNREIKPR